MQPIEINKNQFLKIELLEVPLSLRTTRYKIHSGLLTVEGVELYLTNQDLREALVHLIIDKLLYSLHNKKPSHQQSSLM